MAFVKMRFALFEEKQQKKVQLRVIYSDREELISRIPHLSELSLYFLPFLKHRAPRAFIHKEELSILSTSLW